MRSIKLRVIIVLKIILYINLLVQAYPQLALSRGHLYICKSEPQKEKYSLYIDYEFNKWLENNRLNNCYNINNLNEINVDNLNISTRIKRKQIKQNTQNSNVLLISINPLPIPNGNQGLGYTHTLTATGGIAPYSWNIISGNLPQGLNLNTTSTTATISGTPYFAGSYTISIEVIDANNTSTIVNQTIIINSSNCPIPPSVPILWAVDEDATRIHLWSFEDYRYPTTTATDYGRMKYLATGYAGTYDFYNGSSPDMESVAVDPRSGKAYFMIAGRLKTSQGAPADGPSGTLAFFSYDLNQAKLNIGNIVLKLEGHIQTAHSNIISPEAFAFDPATNRLYFADPVDVGENSSTVPDILNYVDVNSLNPNPFAATVATVVGPITGLGETNNYVDGLEMDENGNFYTVDGTDDEIYTVDKNTGAIIAIYDPNINSGLPGTTDVETIAWDPINNKLIGIDNYGHNIIDLTSGAASNTIISTFVPGTPGMPNDVDFEGSAMWAACLPTTNCSITINSTQGSCNSINNQYTLTGIVTFSNPPSAGTLTVQISGGGSQVFNAPFTSPQSYSIAGQTSDGVNHTVTATFSADGTCTSTTTYTAPASCSGCPPIQCGTTTVQKN